MTLMTSADDPTDLVVGQLYTERVVETFAEITSLHTNATETSVVTAKPFGILLSRKTVLAGCGGASSFLDSGKLGSVDAGFVPDKEQILRGLRQIPRSSWHSGGLFAKDSTLLAAADDVTSQNVLDRLIGNGLSRDISFQDCYLILTGNLVTEAVRKAIIAKIPFIAVAGDVTATATATAEEANLTLLQIDR